MWLYKQTSGEMYYTKNEYSEYMKNPAACPLSPMGCGYSGRNLVTDHANILGKNNPYAESIKTYGPIPRGLWYITSAVNGTQLGPIAMRLVADKQTQTFGRNGFYIHGDNVEHNASEGCIILPHDTRLSINQSVDKILLVVE